MGSGPVGKWAKGSLFGVGIAIGGTAYASSRGSACSEIFTAKLVIGSAPIISHLNSGHFSSGWPSARSNEFSVSPRFTWAEPHWGSDNKRIPGLNSEASAIALSRPETAERAKALAELGAALSMFTPMNMLAVAEAAGYRDPVPYSHSASEFAGGIRRPFPAAFYDRYLRSVDFDENTARTLFFYIDRVLANRFETSPTAESTLLLAYAVRDLNRTARTAGWQATPDHAKAKALARSFVQRQLASGRLTIYENFVGLTDEIFVSLVMATREAVYHRLKRTPVLSRETVEEFLREKLAQASARRYGHRAKIDWAVDIFKFYEPDIALVFENDLRWFLTPGPEFNRRDKWLRQGVEALIVLGYLVKDRALAQIGSDTRPEVYRSAVETQTRVLVGPDNGREFGWINEMVMIVVTSTTADIVVDANTTRVRIGRGINDFIENLRAEVRGFEREQRRQEEAERNVRAEAADRSRESHLIRRRGQHVVQVSGALFRAGRESEGELAADKPVALDRAAEAEAQGFIPLIAKTGEVVSTLRSDQTYYIFNKHGERQLVNVSQVLIDRLDSHNWSAAGWVGAFTQGLKNGSHVPGIKKFHGTRTGTVWEIKVRAGNGTRIIMTHDKATHLWKWLDLVEHDEVSGFVHRHHL